jgi:threonine/homoserine/homoserine lactone efflux protein
MSGGFISMKEKQGRAGRGVFSTAFGIIVLAVGVTWLLQVTGVVPAEINILQFACPACVVLFGLSILTSRSRKRNQNQETTENRNGAM